MTGKHYNWHRRWVVDLAACTASHDSGLVVTFAVSASANILKSNAETWRESLNMPARDKPAHERRLMTEAALVWEREAGKHQASHIPSPEQVRAAREAAGLTQSAAAALIYCTLRGWQEWEAGNRRMHPAFWELFLSKITPASS